MPTNPIGKGTCNFSTNMPLKVRQIIGRVAFPAVQCGEFSSVGNFGLHLMVAGMWDYEPAAALELEQALGMQPRKEKAK